MGLGVSWVGFGYGRVVEEGLEGWRGVWLKWIVVGVIFSLVIVGCLFFFLVVVMLKFCFLLFFLVLRLVVSLGG